MMEIDGVVPALAKALEKRGFAELTPVQVAVLAPELRDADTLVSAQTGSGKTVAFGLALAPTLLAGAERFAAADAPLALVVAPTRELALQVKRELEWLYGETGALHATCVGGMDMRTERRALQRGAHIVVGTPGRLRDHIERASLDVSALQAVVLDEADEMLDMGFREDLEYILGAAPKDRRTMMFSATVPRSIASLAKRYQQDAVRISTQAEQSQHVDIEYRALTVAPNDRENAIINVLRYFEASTALVFCSTRAAVNHMTARFNNRGFSVVALSGELSQNERTHALQAMRNGRARVCIATDVAARGIDLPNCELVVHADLPRNREGLLHRSGRTGRAGRKGVSVLIVPHNWRRRTERLLQGAGIEATWARPPSVVEVMRRDDERLLADPGLTEPVAAEEQAFAQELLNSHGAEQVAAAFVRLYRAGRSAPEELLDTGPKERSGGEKGKRRDDFKNGVWISLSVGRKHQAEPRWLLPMLCRAGQTTKRDIGAIRIEQDETFVEFAPEAVDGFLEAVGPSRTVEKTITVSRLDGIPKSLKAGADARPDGKSGRGAKPRARDRFEPRPAFTLQPDKAPGDEANWAASETSSQPKPSIKPKAKTKAKAKTEKRGPSHGPELATAGARRPQGGGGAKPGYSPLKRKKPKTAG
ncbi:MAG: DEAD/DEAH box helicase [Alphaproteobacteria bacterium]|nr:DEAD/DEAH box helicase [Alphaproteobacteria bacterium]